jgi:hypothetical protein
MVNQVQIVRHALDAIDTATMARPCGIIVNDETRAAHVNGTLRDDSIGEGRGLVSVVHRHAASINDKWLPLIRVMSSASVLRRR